MNSENSENNELSPILSSIYDIANSGFDVLYKAMSESQALNLALYKLLDDGFDTKASLEVKTAMNNALALLRTQETTLKTLDSSIDNVSDELMDIVYKYKNKKCNKMKLIRSKKMLSFWNVYHDDTGTYEAEVVSFDKPSDYGINGGKISKLYITHIDSTELVCEYNRGFGITPTKEVKAFYNEIINELN